MKKGELISFAEAKRKFKNKQSPQKKEGKKSSSDAGGLDGSGKTKGKSPQIIDISSSSFSFLASSPTSLSSDSASSPTSLSSGSASSPTSKVDIKTGLKNPFFQENPDFLEKLNSFKSEIAFNPLDSEHHLALGNFYLQYKKEPQALRSYQDAIVVDPNRWEPYFNSGLIYMTFRSYEQAKRCFESAIKCNDLHVGSYLNLSIIKANTGDMEGACTVLENALQIMPGKIDLMNNLGVFYARLGQREKAVKVWEEAAKKSPGDVEAHFNLAITYNEMNMLDAALMCYRRCLKNGYHEAEILISIAEILEQKGDLAGALKNYRRCLKLSPANAIARRGMALVMAKQGNMKEGLSILRDLLIEDPKDDDTKIRLGLLYSMDGDYKTALKYFSMVNEMRKNTSDIQFNIASAYENLGKIKHSVDSYGEAIRLDPYHQEAYLRLGNLFLQNSQPSKALDIYMTGFNFLKDSALLAYNCGLVSIKLKKSKEAINYLKKAIAIEPYFVSAYFELGQLYYERGKKSWAISTYQKILELDGKNHGIRVELAIIFFESGRIAEARSELEMVIDLKPDYVKAIYYLGLLEYEHGDKERGLTLFQFCLDKDPVGEWGRLAAARLP